MTSQYPLWSDEPATQDLLAFRAVADTATDALFEDDLDPVAIGLSGSWGSGKTSVLELIKAEVEARSASTEGKILVVPTHPWRYDPAVGPKESLIVEVLRALERELNDADPKTRAAFKKLVRKVNWSKAIKMATRTAITAQLPNLESVMGLVSNEPETLESDKGMAEFREEFQSLLDDPALDSIHRVVVLVDDLDRCLPDTVVETLEAIRLFLSAKGMSFVIAADEDRVAGAIQQKLGTPVSQDEEGEDPARLYLHKIVQTTIPLPALSRFDTEAYLFLLLIKDEVHPDTYASYVTRCDELRLQGDSLDGIETSEGSREAEHLAIASRLTPILYEKFHGHPRRIKRFLNDLNVRRAIASRRGITLSTDGVAKLMVLERVLPNEFRQVLDWLAANELRDKLDALDRVANETPPEPTPLTEDGDEKASQDESQPNEAPSQESAENSGFSDSMVRWAKLPPILDASALSNYLYLAASFTKNQIVDTGLPEHLRDLAASLTSSIKIDRSAVTNESLTALSIHDAKTLAVYLGRRMRDQPSIQKFVVESLLRFIDLQLSTQDDVVSALKGLPATDVEPATVVKFRPLNAAVFGPVLERWKSSTNENVQRAIETVEDKWSGNGHQ